jgi:hypothetical protein
MRGEMGFDCRKGEKNHGRIWYKNDVQKKTPFRKNGVCISVYLRKFIR